MSCSLLFIEDNEDILLNLFSWFEARNYICDCGRNGISGLELALNGDFDCIILDLMLPDLDGMEVCRILRDRGLAIPIIMLTARDAVPDRIEGLEAGADDYLVKPFSLKELEARIRAVLRRKWATGVKLGFGPLEMNRKLHTVSRNGMELRLSPSCFKILEILLQAAPDLVPKERLERELWGDDAPEGSALRNHIHELRKIMDKPFEAQLLETVPHLGWRLRLPGT